MTLIYISEFSCSGHIGYIVALNCNKVFVDQVVDALLQVCLLHGEALSGKVLDRLLQEAVHAGRTALDCLDNKCHDAVLVLGVRVSEHTAGSGTARIIILCDSDLHPCTFSQ